MSQKFPLSIFISLLAIGSQTANSQSSVYGLVNDAATSAISSARITLFDSTLSYFQEMRSDENGAFSFPNVPNGNYLIGAEKIGKEYSEQAVSVPLSVVNFTLYNETQQGKWTVIKRTPEPLGGTDLAVLLPDGKIFYCHDTRDPFLFDPLANDTVPVSGDSSIQGCVAPTLLPDGKVIFVGGTDQATYGPGRRKVKTFNPVGQTWTPLPNMLDNRWYPSMTRLSNGKLLVVGGGGLQNPVRLNTSELYDYITGTSQYTDTAAIPNEQSPIVVLFSGKAMMTHRPPQLFEPVSIQWDTAADFLQRNRMPNGDHADHELVVLPEGDVLAIGYKSFTPGVPGNFVERYNWVTDTWSFGANLAPVRSRPETIFLPNKKVLVIAGEKQDTNDTTSVNQWGMTNLCDEYDPYQNSWRRLARMNWYREYHAVPLLVPDGRVIIAGGEGQPGNEPPFSMLEEFKPPFLFRGVRPEIHSLLQTDYQRGETIRFNFQKTDSITGVVLLSNPTVTHMMNCGNNRFLELPFSQTGNSISADIPLDSLIVLDGYYLLFAMVDDIPSIAKIIRINGTAMPTEIESMERSHATQFIIFPNPSNGFITIDMAEENSDYKIEIVNTLREIIIKTQNQKRIDISTLASGIYFMRMEQGHRFYSGKFIKQ